MLLGFVIDKPRKLGGGAVISQFHGEYHMLQRYVLNIELLQVRFCCQYDVTLRLRLKFMPCISLICATFYAETGALNVVKCEHFIITALIALLHVFAGPPNSDAVTAWR